MAIDPHSILLPANGFASQEGRPLTLHVAENTPKTTLTPYSKHHDKNQTSKASEKSAGITHISSAAAALGMGSDGARVLGTF